MDRATCTIIQKRFLRGQQTLTLEGDLLKTEYRQNLSLHEYQVDLQGLTPEPTRMRHVPVTKIVEVAMVSLFGLGVTALGTIVAAVDEKGRMVGLALSAIMGMPLLILGILEWIPTLKQLVDVVLFQGPGGQVALWPDLPNRKEFNEFLAVLVARIRNAQSHEESLLQQLRQAGIIDDWQYDQAAGLLCQETDRPDDP